MGVKAIARIAYRNQKFIKNLFSQIEVEYLKKKSFILFTFLSCFCLLENCFLSICYCVDMLLFQSYDITKNCLTTLG